MNSFFKRTEAAARSFLKFPAPLRLCGFFLFLACTAFAQELSPIAKAPDWSRLEQFQETITHDEFARLLDEVYAPGGVWQATIKIDADDALIAEDAAWSRVFTLRFAKDGNTK